MVTAHPKTIQKRTRLTLGQQIEIARMLSKGNNASVVMSQFSISRRTVSNIKQKSTKLLALEHNQSLSLHTKSIRPTAFPLIEQNLLHFLQVARSAKMPVTQIVLQQKALMIKDTLLQSATDEDFRKRLHQFCASRGWVCKFVRRHALRSVSLCGEAGSASAQAVAADMSTLRKKLREYDVDCIFNVDETGLFFKLLPRQTYLAEHECRKSVRGTKAMKAKDRITAYVCTNADGTAKLPMAIIGKAKNPRCFRLGSPPVPYFNQDNAWSDTKTFRKWFLDVFLPFVRKFTSRPCILLMDNCGPHGTDLIDVRGQVELLTLPPNCTSIHQPMDLGIIAAWKSRYRSLLLQEIVRDVETRQARRDTSTAKRGMRGLSDGFDPHMLDVAQMVFDSWGEVTTMTIARCWRKSQVLPAHVAAEVNAVERKMSRSLEDKDRVRDMVESLKKLSLYTLEDDPIREQLFESTDEGDVENWLNIEEDIEIREAMVEDALQIVKSGDAVMQAQNSSSCSSDEDEDDGVVSPLPAESIIRFHFKQIEDIAVDSAVRDAVFHLRRAKAALLSAKRKERGGARRQLLITELL